MKKPAKEQIIDWLMKSYTMKSSLPGVCHCINVGLAMKAISQQIASINPDDAKIIGILHDIGKIDTSTDPGFKGEKHAHDLVGFDFLMMQGFPEIAYGCLTHSLLCKDLNCEYNRAMFFYNNQDIERVKKLLEFHQYTDIERLLQICDWIIQKKNVCTLENSYDFIKKYYGNYNGLNESLQEARKIKRYFEDRCQQNLYEICDKAIIKEWPLDSFENFLFFLV